MTNLCMRCKESVLESDEYRLHPVIAAVDEVFALEPFEPLVGWLVVLVCPVFQYLFGYVGKGGSKNYSSGSLVFRDTYAAIVLFNGADVWIKFRQATRSDLSSKRKFCEIQGAQCGEEPVLGEKREGVTSTEVKCGKLFFQPILYPPREMGLKVNCHNLGEYNTFLKAKVAREIAASYYGKNKGPVLFEDASHFPIPSMSEEEKSYSGNKKRMWVQKKTKNLFKEFQEKELSMATKTGAHSDHGSDAGSEPSIFGVAVGCFQPAINNITDECTLFPETSSVPLIGSTLWHGGNGAMQHLASVPSSSYESKFDQLNDLEMNYEFLNPVWQVSTPSQQPRSLDNQMHHGSNITILDDPNPSQVDGATQGLAHGSEPQVNPNPEFQQGVFGAIPQKNIDTSGPSFSLKQQISTLQQHVEKLTNIMKDKAIREVDLENKLSMLECQISVLLKDNQHLKNMLQQDPGESGIMIDFQSEEEYQSLVPKTADQANCVNNIRIG